MEKEIMSWTVSERDRFEETEDRAKITKVRGEIERERTGNHSSSRSWSETNWSRIRGD